MQLSSIERAFSLHGLRDDSDKSVDVSTLVMIILSLYEPVQAVHADLLKSLPLAIDMCLNFVLNVYDPYVKCDCV
jgi:hypothetical protein